MARLGRAQPFAPKFKAPPVVSTASTTNGDGSASGVGAASGVGSASTDGVFSTSGTGTATGVGLALFSGIASSDGVGVATGFGVGGSVAAASGVGDALGVGDYLGAAPTAVSGGYVDLPTGRRRTRRERDELREELGILPKKIAAIIKQEAKKQAPRLDDADDARTDKLIAQIERTGQQFKAMYADLLREQIRQEMQDDDEAAMLLLM